MQNYTGQPPQTVQIPLSQVNSPVSQQIQPSSQQPMSSMNLSQLSPSELQNLRTTLQSQIQARVASYQGLKSRWQWIWILLGLLSTFCSLLVVALGSVRGVDETVSQPVVTTAGAVGTVSLGLNTQLQSRMNMVYFNEAQRKYDELQVYIWSDIQYAINQFYQYDQVYTSDGVGSLVTLMGGSTRSSKGIKKTYAYPEVRK